MMSHVAAAITMIVTLSNGGYWFGGETGTIRLKWPIEKGTPASTLVWVLTLDSTTLAQGRQAFKADQPVVTVELSVPEVSTRVALTWHWQMIAWHADDRDGRGGAPSKVIQSGSSTIHVFPPALLKDVRDRIEKDRLVVHDPQGHLSRILVAHRVAHKHVVRVDSIVSNVPRIVFVAPGAIEGDEYAQNRLAALAATGYAILLFEHAGPRLMGYDLTRRHRPDRFEWEARHPLLRQFTREDLRGWFDAVPRDVKALRLPLDEPALAVGAWPGEIEHDEPAPVDALLVTRTTGKGRIVLCQLTFNFAEPSPRELLFVSNAIDYMRTRPEPTPAPSRRMNEKLRRIADHLIDAGLLGDKP